MTGSATEVDRRQLLHVAGAIGVVALSESAAAAPGRRDAPIGLGRGQPFDEGWRFRLGVATGQEAANVNDMHWRTVDLPHDWSIEDLPPVASDPQRIVGPFDRDAEGGTLAGYVRGGEGWYRKRFRLADPRPGRVELVFDGVYLDTEVWINGHSAATHVNGYTALVVDLTPFLSPGGENLVAVRVRDLGWNARWHSGAGIYRHVRIDVLPEPTRIVRWGTTVATRRIDGGRATLDLQTLIAEPASGLTLVTRIRDAAGRVVWQADTAASAAVAQTATLSGVALWSPEAPNLHTLESELRRGGRTIDRTTIPFGVRIVAFDAASGMTVNGVATKLRGGCIHHDHGPLGAAAFDGAEERKVALLKARGFNAVRPSHNPFSPAFLDACDRHGMMVIGETFDVWHEHKVPADYAAQFDAHWRDDLDTIVRSARHHPSIVMWSIGNEIPGRFSAKGIETQWQLADAVHRLDPTRPVTAAINGFAGHRVDPAPASLSPGRPAVPDRAGTVFLDLIGYNYKLADYEPDHALYPDRVFFGSESLPREMFAIWDLTERTPWLIGDFVWTAMDYLGEVGIGGSLEVPAAAAAAGSPFSGTWPWIVSYCGDLDLVGRQKPASRARDVAWGISPLEIAVQRPVAEGKVEAVRLWGWSDELPSWTWPGAEGRTLAVRVYTAGDLVELRLDGRVVERRPMTPADRHRAEFQVRYAPGALEAVAFRGGHEIARRRLETVGPAAAVRVTPEQTGLRAGRGELGFVGIEIVDAQGRPMPDVAVDLRASVAGAGELIAFASASPFAQGSFQSPRARSWHGHALAVVRSSGVAGRVAIAVDADGLRGGRADMRFA